MAVYVCSICGERIEGGGKPEECAVCGGREFTVEGESASQTRTEGYGDAAGDAETLFCRHNMTFPQVRSEQDQKDRQQFEAAAREKARQDSEKAEKNGDGARGVVYSIVLILCILGWLASFASCPFTETPIPWLSSSISVAVIFFINEAAYKRYMKKKRGKAQGILEEGERQIAQFNESQARSFQAYCAEFERVCRQLSEEYVGTEFVIRIAEWIFEPLDRMIREANREERIAAVTVEYSYSIYGDRIVCGSGTYDYRSHGLRDVDDPVCQTALAYAIAAAVKILVMQKYPRDLSGTPATVSNSVFYGREYAEGKTVYTAPNGNYNAASVW